MAPIKVKPRSLLKTVEEFSEAAILVIGDIILDSYIWGEVDRICPEAPVPVVDVRRESSMLGGAGNVVVNLKSLGCDVSLAGIVGNDAHQEEIIRLLKKKEIVHEGVVTDTKRPTTKKTRIVAGHQQVVRFDHESRVLVTEATNKKIFQYLKKAWGSFDAIIVSDYGKGVISPKLMKCLQELNRKSPKIISIDPKERNMEFYKGVTLVTPNKKEAAQASGKEIHTESDLKEAGRKIIHRLQCEYLAITLGAEGMALFKRNGEYLKIPTFAKEVFDVSGAGDTVVSTLTLALSSGASLSEAAILANYAAGVVVGKLGTAHVTSPELKKYIQMEKQRISPKQLIAQSLKRFTLTH